MSNEWKNIDKYIKYDILKRLSECDSNFRDQYNETLDHYITATIVYTNITSVRDRYDCIRSIALFIKHLFEKTEGFLLYNCIICQYQELLPKRPKTDFSKTEQQRLNDKKQFNYISLRNLIIDQMEKQIRIL